MENKKVGLTGNDQYSTETRDEYQARKQEVLKEQEEKERAAELYSKGLTARAVRRKLNRKPRRKMKKL